MKYRKKETCKICNKTLLLLPHLKTAHKIFSTDEYDKETAHPGKDTNAGTDETIISITKSNSSKISPEPDDTTAEETRPRKTLHEAMVDIEKRYRPRKAKRKSSSVIVTGKFRKKRKLEQQSSENYSLEEKVRYYVHKIKSWYQVIATGLSLKDPRHDDGFSAARYLQRTCMDDFSVEQILEVMSLLPQLCPYYRFSAYYEYAKFRCMCSGGECCTPVDRDLRLFCKGTCDESLNCKACKSFPRVNIHKYIDWFHCKVCKEDYEYTEKMRAINWRGY